MIVQKIFGAAILSLMAILLIATTLCAQSDIDEHRRCAQCGMDRKDYGFSRVLLRYDDGTAVGTCSLHCAAIQLDAKPALKIKSIEVADYNTRTLIDAEKAYWVIGGNKEGVMTRTATWAFADKKDAEKYIKGHGGRLGSFKESLNAVTRELPKKSGAGKMDKKGQMGNDMMHKDH